MFFVKIINFISINTALIRRYNNMIFQDSFFIHESPSCSKDNDTSFCYLVCVEYNYMLIPYAYMCVSIILGQYIVINYIKSINYRMYIAFINPGLLIFSIYSLFYIKLISILVLEVSVCNLNAFSLYYWLGFQLIRRRDHYYNNNCIHDVSNTAYILVNPKISSRNTFRRYLL